ncbi:IS256 family transposase, partial [Lactobacillus amylovorus]|uniref:IS256 family transposase n=1 Tax=Lactobacillus amylovorus TaxID=1604 RepID=UPI00232CF98E
CIAPTENIEIWSEMLKGFKSRGLEQVELFLSDGVVGMKEAICQSYPKARFQRCLVHVMRNISAKMRVDDRQKALDEFKQIHTQSNKEMAVQVLHEFYQNWEKAYKNVVRDLRQVEPDLLTFYNYPPAIRASIYSTNMIESFNNRLKRKTKPKTEFPTKQSLDTFIGVQAMDYNDRYFNRIHKGFGQVRDTLES